MMRQIKLLCGLELCNLFSFNVIRHTKDKQEKKKSILLSVLVLFVVVVMLTYLGGMCYGLIYLGAGQIIPAYLIMISTIVSLVFSVLKAGSILFRKEGYDIFASLPLSNTVIVTSRFLRFYLENLLVSFLVMITGMSIYGIFCKPAAATYVAMIFSIFIIPFLPVAISTGIGALVKGIASRMKHKSLVEAGLSVLLVIGILAISMVFSEQEELSMEMIQNLVDNVTKTLRSVYPPAVILGDAILQGNCIKILLFGAITFLILMVVMAIVIRYYESICHKLFSTIAKHNYQMESLQKSSLKKALIVREARRYFASGIYVSNTIIGPILATVLSIGLLFVDLEKMMTGYEIPISVNYVIPFLMAGVFSMMDCTSVSISMEGKQWWIVKTLPLTTKDILDGKYLFYLCLIAPFYVVSEIFLVLALKPTIWEAVWILLLPASLILFIGIFGITINLFLPKMNWENEVSVVKQSASAMIGVLSGLLVAVIGMIFVMITPAGYQNVTCGIFCAILVVVTVLLYLKNSKWDLEKIG